MITMRLARHFTRSCALAAAFTLADTAFAALTAVETTCRSSSAR